MNELLNIIEYQTPLPKSIKNLGYTEDNAIAYYSVDYKNQYIELRWKSNKDFDYTVLSAKVYGMAQGGADLIHNDNDDRLFNNRINKIKMLPITNY